MSRTSAPSRIRIALAQLDAALGDKAANVSSAARAMRAAADQQAELVMFPELFLTGYFTRDRTAGLAESLDGPSLGAIRAYARDYRVMALVGFAERDPGSGRLYDSVCLVSRDGGVIGHYRKTHLYGDEPRYFAAGEACEAVGLDACRVGLMICFDVEFPEVARILALQGARLLLVSSANMTPFETHQDVYLRARALENHAFCALVNRVGTEENARFFWTERGLRPVRPARLSGGRPGGARSRGRRSVPDGRRAGAAPVPDEPAARPVRRDHSGYCHPFSVIERRDRRWKRTRPPLR